MLQKLFPKERDFFPTFDKISTCLSDAIIEILASVEGKKSKTDCLQRAKEIEIQANQVVRESIDHLHDTFVTPFDRSHIFQFLVLQSEIVSIARLLNEKLYHYGVDALPLESVEIVVNCGTACTLIRKMVGQIKKIKRPAETLKACVNIYEIAAQNNLLAFQATKDLFSDENDMKRLLKIKEINHDLISITKKFEALSFLIEKILLEYA